MPFSFLTICLHIGTLLESLHKNMNSGCYVYRSCGSALISNFQMTFVPKYFWKSLGEIKYFILFEKTKLL